MENKYKDKIIKTETFKCMLCHNAACTKACPNGFDPARFIRSIRFENKDGSLNLDFPSGFSGNVFAIAKSVALNV